MRGCPQAVTGQEGTEACLGLGVWEVGVGRGQGQAEEEIVPSLPYLYTPASWFLQEEAVKGLD